MNPTNNPTAIACPKCQAPMLTHNRQGVHIEQCTQCRGIFLDFGELEALSQMQMQWMQQQQQSQMAQPPMGQPGWGAPQPGYQQGYRKPYKKGFMGMLFSS